MNWSLLVPLSFVILASSPVYCSGNGNSEVYSGFQVIRATTNSPETLSFLQLYDELHQVNVWGSEISNDGVATATFHVHPDLVDEVTRMLAKLNVEHTVLSYDLKKDIDASMQLNTQARQKSSAAFDAYLNFDEIQQFLVDQVALCGSNCRIQQIGASTQGRPLNVVTLTGAPTSGCTQKPAIWIDAGIHAREWISVSTGQYILNRLIEEYDTDEFVKEMRDTFDWHILPVVNPDGYSYSWTNDRLWRKTRQSYTGTACIGADCNRNYDFQWMTVGASSNPCSETFAGPTAHSEPESVAQANYMMARNGIWDFVLTLHTYGQLWMTPWGYTNALPGNYAAMYRVGTAAVQAILDTHGKVYELGSSANILYQSSGTSRDWAAGVPQVPFVYTAELRDLNSFQLPPTEILPTGEEVWAGLKAAIGAMRLELPHRCVVPPF